MAKELGDSWVVAIPQREHVAVTLDHDRLPPAVGEAFLGDDQMAWRNLVPAAGQALGDRVGSRRPGRPRPARFGRQARQSPRCTALCRTLGTNAWPVAWIRPTGSFLATSATSDEHDFVDPQVHGCGGLGNEVGLGADEPRATRLLLLVKAEHDQGEVVAAGLRGRMSWLPTLLGGFGYAPGLVLVAVGLALGLVMIGLQKSRRGPVWGPWRRLMVCDRMAAADPVVLSGITAVFS